MCPAPSVAICVHVQLWLHPASPAIPLSIYTYCRLPRWVFCRGLFDAIASRGPAPTVFLALYASSAVRVRSRSTVASCCGTVAPVFAFPTLSTIRIRTGATATINNGALTILLTPFNSLAVSI